MVRFPPISAVASSAQPPLYVAGVYVNRIGTRQTAMHKTDSPQDGEFFLAFPLCMSRTAPWSIPTHMR